MTELYVFVTAFNCLDSHYVYMLCNLWLEGPVVVVHWVARCFIVGQPTTPSHLLT